MHAQIQHPLVKQLPAVLDTTGWGWQRFEPPDLAHKDFWIARDTQGNKWLAKLRGSFRGYRELIFERLVQRIGWPCQSSAFTTLAPDAAPLLHNPDLERTQLLTWFLPEHVPGSCGSNCPNGALKLKLDASPPADPLEVLKEFGLESYIAWPLSQILAPVFGGNEPAGCLVTDAHQAILIDGELMFSSTPSDVRETSWWQRPDGAPSPAGQRLTLEACKAVGSLEDKDLDASLEIPEGIEVRQLWDLRSLVFKARDSARVWSIILAQDTE
jgi:hypothetical protein